MSEQVTTVTGNGATREAPPRQGETKHERFLRLAPPRVENALHRMDIVAKLASPQNEYSQEEASRLIEALRQRVDQIERLMLNKSEERKPFSFG